MINETTGERYAMRAIFTGVEPPARIVWEDIDTGMISSTTLTQLDDGRTEMRIHQTNAPEAVATPEAQAGFATSLDRLAAYLATR